MAEKSIIIWQTVASYWVMESGKTRINDCLDIAHELEIINSDCKRESGTVAAISSIPEEDEGLCTNNNAEVKLDDKELVIINAIRSKKGGLPMRAATAAAAAAFKHNSNDRKNVQCRYCKKSGHF